MFAASGISVRVHVEDVAARQLSVSVLVHHPSLVEKGALGFVIWPCWGMKV